MKTKRKYSKGFKLFNVWVASDNVIRGEGGWRCQCMLYSHLFTSKKELYKYFKKEYIN